MHGQHFHRAAVAVTQIRGGVPERLPVGGGSAGWNRTILPVLQRATGASESPIPDAGSDMAGTRLNPMTEQSIRKEALLKAGGLSPPPPGVVGSLATDRV